MWLLGHSCVTGVRTHLLGHCPLLMLAWLLGPLPNLDVSVLPYLATMAILRSLHSEVHLATSLGHGTSHGALAFVGDGVAAEI